MPPKDYYQATVALPLKAAYTVAADIEDAKGGNEYLAAGWDPEEKRIQGERENIRSMIERNNERTIEAAKVGDTVRVMRLASENRRLLGRLQDLDRAWRRGNEREDRQHDQIPKALTRSLKVMRYTIDRHKETAPALRVRSGSGETRNVQPLLV